VSAQTFGQILGLALIATLGGAILFGFLNIARAVSSFFAQRRRSIAFAQIVAEKAEARAKLPEPKWTHFEPIIASPPCEMVAPRSSTFRRGEYPRVVIQSSRTGGKTEALRQLKSLHELAHERPYSTPPEAMLLGFAGNRNGEIAVGARLDFERQIMDGDRPSSIEPRGIFS